MNELPQPESTEIACRAAKRLGIPEVMDAATGESLNVSQLLTVEKGKAVEIRNDVRTGLERGSPLYRCPLCASPLRLNSMASLRLYYFKHTQNNHDCPWYTGAQLTREEIEARRYNGAKESEDHIFMKRVLRESLELDPEFSGIESEQVWKGNFGAWRKPDISATVGSRKVAMEVQLSTTFLDVIVGRREFYLRNAAALLWVFRRFDIEKRRLTVEDVFYPNNRNAFIAGKHTLEESRRQGRFVLECRWLEPVERDGQVVDEWRQAYVGWSDLTLDLATQRVFHFDYDGARAIVERTIVERREVAIRERFERFWLSGRRAENSGYDWSGLRADFDTMGVALPRSHFEPDFESLINQLYSAKLGRPVGYNFRKLLQVAHKVYDNYPHHLWWFGQMLKRHGTDRQLVSEDTTGKWKGGSRVQGRRDLIRERMRLGDPALAPDLTYALVVKFVFPELAESPDYPGSKTVRFS